MEVNYLDLVGEGYMGSMQWQLGRGINFSTCFEQPSAHHQENQLYQYIIWYISLCVGGRLVCRSLNCIPDGHLHTVIYNRWCIGTIDSPDDENWVARNM